MDELREGRDMKGKLGARCLLVWFERRTARRSHGRLEEDRSAIIKAPKTV